MTRSLTDRDMAQSFFVIKPAYIFCGHGPAVKKRIELWFSVLWIKDFVVNVHRFHISAYSIQEKLFLAVSITSGLKWAIANSLLQFVRNLEPLSRKTNCSYRKSPKSTVGNSAAEKGLPVTDNGCEAGTASRISSSCIICALKPVPSAGSVIKPISSLSVRIHRSISCEFISEQIRRSLSFCDCICRTDLIT